MQQHYRGADVVQTATSVQEEDVPDPITATAILPLSIISDCLLLREGTAALLSAQLHLNVVRTYGSDDERDSTVANPDGHVVLIDGNIDGDLIIAWLRFWRARTPPAHTIVFGIASDPPRILSFLEAGANGYTLQQATASEVALTIRTVQTGKSLCSPEIAAHVFARLMILSARDNAKTDNETLLTSRELEVLRLIAADYSNKQIAAALVIEIRTVKHHVHNILEKLHMRHRWDAARAAIERGWIA